MKNNQLLIKLFFVALALSISSCRINFSDNEIAGNGTIVTKQRAINESFDKINVSNGITAKISQNDHKEIAVTIDENLQENIEIYVENQTLFIKATEMFVTSEDIVVTISNPEFKGIKTSSGAKVSSQNTIKSIYLLAETSSGSEIDIDVEADELLASSSSGSEINLKGKALTADFQSSSGSSIDGSQLTANNINATSSSGSSISANPILKINADASSGSEIKLKKSPKEMILKESSGASITN